MCRPFAFLVRNLRPDSRSDIVRRWDSFLREEFVRMCPRSKVCVPLTPSLYGFKFVTWILFLVLILGPKDWGLGQEEDGRMTRNDFRGWQFQFQRPRGFRCPRWNGNHQWLREENGDPVRRGISQICLFSCLHPSHHLSSGKLGVCGGSSLEPLSLFRVTFLPLGKGRG